MHFYWLERLFYHCTIKPVYIYGSSLINGTFNLAYDIITENVIKRNLDGSMTLKSVTQKKGLLINSSFNDVNTFKTTISNNIHSAKGHVGPTRPSIYRKFRMW